mgnify:CR=1 FL=1
MRQLQDKQGVYIVEDDQRYPPGPYNRAEVHHYHHQGRPRRPRSLPIGVIAFAPFWFGMLATMVAVFAIDDPRWLITRMAAALCIMFLFGMVGCVLGGVWMAIRDTFTRDSWRDYE